MRKRITFLFFLSCYCIIFNLRAQVDTLHYEGLKIMVPGEKKPENRSTKILFTCGYQVPVWIHVPFTPENPGNLKLKGNMEISVPGWYFGTGILKKSRKKFDFGLLLNFYRQRIPVAYSGQRATSDWVYEQSGNTSFFTENFEYDLYRNCDVISIRASLRYIQPMGKSAIWISLTPGTFTTRIQYNGTDKSYSIGEYRATIPAVSIQSGIMRKISNDQGRELFSVNLYADLMGPKVEDRYISLYQPGWNFINENRNFVISPFRFGFSVEL